MVNSIIKMAQTTVSLIFAAVLGVSGASLSFHREALVVQTTYAPSFAIGGIIFAGEGPDLDHEYGHLLQEEHLEGLYLPLVALPSIILAGLYVSGEIGWEAATTAWPEDWADELGK